MNFQGTDNIDKLDIFTTNRDNVINQQVYINDTLISESQYQEFNIQTNLITSATINDYNQFNDWDGQKVYILQSDLNNNTLRYLAKRENNIYFDNTTQNIFNIEMQGQKILSNFNNQTNEITIQYKQFVFIIKEDDQLYGNIDQFSSYIKTSQGQLQSIQTTLEMVETSKEQTLIQFIPIEWQQLNISIQFQNYTIQNIELNNITETINQYVTSIQIKCQFYYSIDYIYVKFQLQNSDSTTDFITPYNTFLIYINNEDQQINQSEPAQIYDSKYLMPLFNTTLLQDENATLQDYVIIDSGIQNSFLTGKLQLNSTLIQQQLVQDIQNNYSDNTSTDNYTTQTTTALLFTQQDVKIQNQTGRLLIYNRLSLIYKGDILISQPHQKIQINNYNSEKQVTKFKVVNDEQQPLKNVEVILQFTIQSYSQTLSAITDQNGIGTFECSVYEQSCQLQDSVQLQIKSGKNILKDTLVQIIPQNEFQNITVQVQNENKKAVIIAVSVSCCAVVIILVVAILVVRHYKKNSYSKQQNSNIDMQELSQTLKQMSSRSLKYGDNNMSFSVI